LKAANLRTQAPTPGWWLSGIGYMGPWNLRKGLGFKPLLVCRWKSCQHSALELDSEVANGLSGRVCCCAFWKKRKTQASKSKLWKLEVGVMYSSQLHNVFSWLIICCDKHHKSPSLVCKPPKPQKFEASLVMVFFIIF
jgi:hypothetical protein